MGTAPPSRQHPAMPDPVRLVARSVSVLKRLGLTEREACLMIWQVANALHLRFAESGEQPQPWLTDIGHAVLTRVARLPKPDQASTEVGNGNRGGSRTGSTESTAG